MEDIRAGVAWISQNELSHSAPECKSMLDQIVEKGETLRAVSERLLLRAREKDPEKQMYNEDMCSKIEQLCVDVNLALESVSDDLKARVAAAHALFLKQQAASVEYRAALLTSIESVVRRESDERYLFCYTEVEEWDGLLQQSNQSFSSIRSREILRHENRWKSEQRRRDAERLALVSWQKTGADQIAEAVDACLTAAADAAMLCDSVTSTRDAKTLELSRAIDSLLTAVLRAPDDDNIRRLRLGNTNFRRVFGHPAARAEPLPSSAAGGWRSPAVEGCPHGDGDSVVAYTVGELDPLSLARNPGLHPAARKFFAVSAILGLAGYEHAYVRPPRTTSDLPDLRWFVGRGGWEDFGERFLVVVEPVADENPADWMEWHAHLKVVQAAVAAAFVRLSQSRKCS